MKLTEQMSARLTGEGREQILIIYTERTLAVDLVRQAGADLLVDRSIVADFTRWLNSMPIDDVARQLQVSRARAGRLRKAFGLAGTYRKARDDD